MKKLMTVIAAATAAFGLFAAVAPITDAGVEFTEMDPETTYNWKAPDDDGNYLWSAAEGADITTEIKEGADGNFLSFEGDELMRLATAKPDSGLNTVAIDGGVNFEQSVKFSGFEEIPADLGDAKIAVWLMASDTETNLYVTTKSLDEAFEPGEADVHVKIPNVTVTPDDFCNLKITAIPAYKVGDYTVPGFVITVNGTELTAQANLFPGAVDGAVMTPAAAALIAADKLFPSRIHYGDDEGAAGKELTGVAFKGTGAIENIWISPGNAYEVAATITAPEHTTIESVTVGGVVIEPKDGKYVVAKGAEVVVTLKADQGWKINPAEKKFSAVDDETEFDFDDIEISEDVTGTILLITEDGTNVFETIAAAVEAAPETGATIELTADLSGAGIGLWADNPKSITIDLGGKTYTCVGPAVGSNGTASQAFHLEKGNTVTIKNGTVTSTENSGVTMLVQNYCDLTVTGVTLDGSNLPQALYWADSTRTTKVEGPTYTMSNNSGTIALGEGTVIKVSTKTNSGVAFDTCKYGTYALPSITVNGATINGDVELAGGNLTLTAGTLTGKLVDAGIGDGVITKGDTFEADAPAGYKWVEGQLTKIEYATLTITPVDNCTIVVSNATAAVESGATFDKDEKVALTVYRTPAEGYELDNCLAVEPITMSDDVTVTAAVVAKQGGDIPDDPEKDIDDNTKPEDIGLNPEGPFKDAEKDELIQLSKWANKAGVKAAAINEDMQFGVGGAPLTEMADAYLLDCTPAQLTEAKEAFKFNAEDLAAAMAGKETTATFAGKTYNGKIEIKAFSDVACTTPAEDEADAKFYKAFLVK